MACVFAGNERERYRYVIGSKKFDCRIFAKCISEKLQGRGGGKAEMVQGSVQGTESEIREALEACKNELQK